MCLRKSGRDVFSDWRAEQAAEAGFEAAMEVALVFKTAVEGRFENIFFGGAEESCGVFNSQAVNEFGGGASTMLPEYAGGVFRRAPCKCVVTKYAAQNQIGRGCCIRCIIVPAVRLA